MQNSSQLENIKKLKKHQKALFLPWFSKVAERKNNPKSVQFPIENRPTNISSFKDVFYSIWGQFWDQFGVHLAKLEPDSLESPLKKRGQYLLDTLEGVKVHFWHDFGTIWGRFY